MLVKSLNQSIHAALRSFLLALALTGSISVANAAGEATPMAEDAELEVRVLELSHKLRCLVCQNQSIAESNAPLAIDLRNQVREQLAAGKSEDAVVDYLVGRYGDFVLYLPPFKGATLFLWLGPAVLLVGGAGWLSWRLRNRAAEAKVAPHLTQEERASASALLAGTPNSPEEPRS